MRRRHLLLHLLLVLHALGVHGCVTAGLMHAHAVSAMLHVGIAVLVRSCRALLVAVLASSLVPVVVATLSCKRVAWSSLELVLHWQSLEELGDLEVELVSCRDIVPLRRVVVQLLESLEPKLVLGLFIDDVTVFFKLVVADLELPVVDGPVMELLKCVLSLIRSFEAHE